MSLNCAFEPDLDILCHAQSKARFMPNPRLQQMAEFQGELLEKTAQV
jgi:hypothetical protein